jgi:hypothetical protein
VLVTNVERRIVDVVPAGGGAALAELRSTPCRCARRTGPGGAGYWEVEIEQRAGKPADCVAVGAPCGAIPPGAVARHQVRARLSAVLPPDAVAAPPPPIAAGDTLVSATRAIIAAQLGRLRAVQPAVRRGDDPEAVHEMRVAVRRLRTASAWERTHCRQPQRGPQLAGDLAHRFDRRVKTLQRVLQMLADHSGAGSHTPGDRRFPPRPPA